MANPHGRISPTQADKHLQAEGSESDSTPKEETSPVELLVGRLLNMIILYFVVPRLIEWHDGRQLKKEKERLEERVAELRDGWESERPILLQKPSNMDWSKMVALAKEWGVPLEKRYRPSDIVEAIDKTLDEICAWEAGNEMKSEREPEPEQGLRVLMPSEKVLWRTICR